MNRFLKIILLSTVMTFAYLAQARSQSAFQDSGKQTVEIYINNEKYLLQTTSQNIRVDIYSILGAKVTSFEIKSGFADTAIYLTKGYYIVKAENSSRKIAVR